ncbi:hypothetical protein ACYATM_01070 [Lactobacillaceae bacterium Scapto_B20]
MPNPQSINDILTNINAEELDVASYLVDVLPDHNIHFQPELGFRDDQINKMDLQNFFGPVACAIQNQINPNHIQKIDFLKFSDFGVDALSVYVKTNRGKYRFVNGNVKGFCSYPNGKIMYASFDVNSLYINALKQVIRKIM